MRSVEKQLLPSMKVSREATLLPLSNEPYKGHSDGESQPVPVHRQEDSTLNIHTLEACYLVFLNSYSLQMHFRRSNNYLDVSFSPSQIVCLCMRCVTSTSAVTYWGRAHVIFFFFFSVWGDGNNRLSWSAGRATHCSSSCQADSRWKKAKKQKKQPCPVGENGKNKQTTTSGHWKTSPKAEDSFCGFHSSKMWLKKLRVLFIVHYIISYQISQCTFTSSSFYS